MREDQFSNFKEDVQVGLSLALLSKLYDLSPEEVQKGIAWHNRGILSKVYTALMDFFKNKVFQVEIKFTRLKITHLLKSLKDQE